MRDEVKKKRVLRACDTCRIKKAKCDGSKPCSRCQTDNQVCTYAHRRKQSERVFTPEYVEMLEGKFHKTLKSFMFLVNELGDGKDCSMYIEGPNPNIASVIDRISQQVKKIRDPSEMDQKVTQLIESSKFGIESDYSDSEQPKVETTPRPKGRRGRPPKVHSAIIKSSAQSPISRPDKSRYHEPELDVEPDAKLEPVTPPPLPLRNEELDKTKNSLIMQWQNPSSESFDLYRASFDDTYVPSEPLYAESFVLNDEFGAACPTPFQAPEFDHPLEYDEPMENYSDYSYNDLNRSVSVEI